MEETKTFRPIPCELNYGKKTASGTILPTAEAAVMMLDEETLEFVFCDEKNFELLRVGPENIEAMELTSRGLFAAKSELLAVTEMDDEGSVLVFCAKNIRRTDKEEATRMIDSFAEGLYIHRAHMWIRDEVAFEEYQQQEDE